MFVVSNWAVLKANKMKLDLLLTDEIAATKPQSAKVIFDFGKIEVIFKAIDETEQDMIAIGIHCVIEDETENVQKWLKQHEFCIIGDGNPQLQNFSIMHVK